MTSISPCARASLSSALGESWRLRATIAPISSGVLRCQGRRTAVKVMPGLLQRLRKEGAQQVAVAAKEVRTSRRRRPRKAQRGRAAAKRGAEKTKAAVKRQSNRRRDRQSARTVMRIANRTTNRRIEGLGQAVASLRHRVQYSTNDAMARPAPEPWDWSTRSSSTSSGACAPVP